MLQLELEGNAVQVNGSLIFRDVKANQKPPSGMKLMLVAGVVMVPQNFVIPGESQVQIKGYAQNGSLAIFTNPGVRALDEKYLGWEIGDILTEAIWKF